MQILLKELLYKINVTNCKFLCRELNNICISFARVCSKLTMDILSAKIIAVCYDNFLIYFLVAELTIKDRDRDPITDRDHFFGDRDRIEITFWKSDR